MMKKLYLLIGLLGIIHFSKGQVVITAADVGNAGDVVFMRQVNYTVGAPATGSNMTWDFSTLLGLGNDTLRFLPVNSVPGGANFPQSSFVLQDGFLNQFMQKDNSGLFLNGFGVDGLDQLPGNQPIAVGPFRLTPRVKVLHFPSQYGSPATNFTSQGTSRFTFAYDTTIDLNGTTVTIDSVRINATARIVSSIEGEGTVIFPGSQEPALLQKAFQRISFTLEARVLPPIPFLPPIWTPLPFSLPSITNTFYRFWSPGKKAPIMEITMDSAGVNTQSARAQRYLLITATSSLVSCHTDFTLWPNPAQNQVYLAYSSAIAHGKHTVQIINPAGKIIKVFAVEGAESCITISDLPSGVYYLKPSIPGLNFKPKKLIISR